MSLAPSLGGICHWHPLLGHPLLGAPSLGHPLLGHPLLGRTLFWTERSAVRIVDAEVRCCMAIAGVRTAIVPALDHGFGICGVAGLHRGRAISAWAAIRVHGAIASQLLLPELWRRRRQQHSHRRKRWHRWNRRRIIEQQRRLLLGFQAPSTSPFTSTCQASTGSCRSICAASEAKILLAAVARE
jgi:hypothetical protein